MLHHCLRRYQPPLQLQVRVRPSTAALPPLPLVSSRRKGRGRPSIGKSSSSAAIGAEERRTVSHALKALKLRVEKERELPHVH